MKLTTQLSEEIASLALEHYALEVVQRQMEMELEDVLGRKFELHCRLETLQAIESQMELML